METNKIYLGDCLDLFDLIPDNSIKLLLTDPPFNTTDLRLDKDRLSNEWLEHSLRVVDNDGYLVSFGSIELLAEIAKVFSNRFTGFWYKTNPVMRTHSAKKPMSQSEPYGVFAHPKHKIKNLTWNKIKKYGHNPYKKVQHNRGYKRGGKDSLDRASSSGFTKQGYVNVNDGYRYLTDVLTAPNKPGMKHSERTPHPTQKPVKILQEIIQWFTNPGDLILDPFAGSGSTGVAALRLSRQFICFEKDEEYFDIANKRIKKHLRGLF